VILVDSDVLIEHLRGDTAARDRLVHARHSSGPPGHAPPRLDQNMNHGPFGN